MRIWRACDVEGCEYVATRFVAHSRYNPGHGYGPVVRWTEPQSYREAHNLLRLLHGPSSVHPCSRCGTTEGARDWALREDLSAWGEHRWSPNPEDYAVLCKLCHMNADVTGEQKSAIMMRALAEKRSDPEYDKVFREKQARNFALGASKGGHAHNASVEAKRAADPEYDQWYAAVMAKSMAKNNLKIRKCAEASCTKGPMSKGNLTQHQRATCHGGWIEVDPESWGTRGAGAPEPEVVADDEQATITAIA